MNEFLLLWQSVQSVDPEILHLALAGIAAVFSSACALFGGLVAFMVKRDIKRRDEELKELRDCQYEHRERIARLEERTREN